MTPKKFDEICFLCGNDEKVDDVTPGHVIGESDGGPVYDDIPLCARCRDDHETQNIPKAKD